MEAVKVDSLVLFQILGGKNSIFSYKYNDTCGFSVEALYWVEENPFYLKSVEKKFFFLTKNGYWILSNAVSLPMEMTFF